MTDAAAGSLTSLPRRLTFDAFLNTMKLFFVFSAPEVEMCG
jgi:hypothetical protein